MTAVSIRPYQLSDAEKLYEASKESVADLQPFLPWCHPQYIIDEARSWIQLQVEQFRLGKEYQFVIVSTEGKFLGGCGLNGIDQENRRANLGYWIRSSEIRRGAATAATRLLVSWAFDNTELNRLEIVVSTVNIASLRVAEKAGAVREGTLQSRLLLHGVAHDAVVFSFVRKDFESRGSLHG